MAVSSSPIRGELDKLQLRAAATEEDDQISNLAPHRSPILPTFLVVGAPKSGTTSLDQYLRSHPDVFMSKSKDLRLFAPPGELDTSERMIRNMFKGAAGYRAIGEVSGGYLSNPAAPEKLKAALGPGTKIVVTLRNPVNMAFSAWRHHTREGWEWRSLAQAIAAEEEGPPDLYFLRKAGPLASNLRYIARASYPAQLERYFRHFPATNIRIYIFEEFFQPGLPQWQDLCIFLGINPNFVPREKIHNAAWTPRSLTLQRWYNRPGWLTAILKPLIPLPHRNNLRKGLGLLNRKPGKMQSLDANLRRHLEDIFRPDVRRLEEMLGKNLRDFWFY